MKDTDSPESDGVTPTCLRAELVGVWRHDLISDALHWSQDVFQIFEIDEASFSGSFSAFEQFIYPADVVQVSTAYEQFLRDQIPYSLEHRIITGTGAVRWVHEVGFHEKDENGDVVATQGYVRDITEPKRKQLAFEEAERRFHESIDALPHGFLIVDAKTRVILHCNRLLADKLGRAKSDIEGLTVESLHPERIRPFVAQNFSQHVYCETRVTPSVPFERIDGSLLFMEITSRLYSIEGDQQIIGVIRDVSSVLQRSDVAEKLIESARSSIVITDQGANIIWTNESWSKLTGYSRIEALGENPRFLKSGFQEAAFYQAMWLSIEQHNEWHGEVWNRRKDGELFCAKLSI